MDQITKSEIAAKTGYIKGVLQVAEIVADKVMDLKGLRRAIQYTDDIFKICMQEKE